MSKKKPFEHEIDPELLAEIEAWEPQEHDEPEGYYFSNPTPILNPHRCRLTIPDTISGLTRMDTSV